MKLNYGLLGGIVLLILITLVNLYAQDPFIIKDPYPGDKYTTNGVSWGDWNDDGYDDVFLGNGAQGYKFEDFLYQNNGDGTFTKITGQSIVTEVHLSGGATWGDYDDDGDLDLYVTLTEDSFQGEDTKNLLYINNNDGTFSKSTVAGPPITEGEYSNAAGWGDYDNDGDLDLFVKNGWQGVKDEHSLYKNNDDGTFTEVNAGDMTGSAGAAFIGGFAWCDYDLDGDLDIFTCSGVGDNNHLWRNDGSDTFTDVGSFDAAATNGASWGDYDNDGDFDLFLANYGDGGPETNDFYENNGDGTFTKRTDLILTTEDSYSLGSAWGDIDNDGDLDLFVANDYEYDTNPNFLYVNNGDGTFTKNTTSVAVSDPMSQAPHGVAFSDYDNDGFLDMFGAVHGPNFFLENQEPENGNTNHWLQVKLTGTTSTTTAIGAIVKVTASISGSSVTQLREISSQTGMASNNSYRAHFGLGEATIVPELRIEWPSGTIQILNDVSVDQILSITEGASSETISVTSPNGGENWPVDSIQEITWSSSGTSGTVDLEYSINNGSSWTIIESAITDDGSYDWTIPNDPSTECLVRVSDTDGDPSDVSNATFTISSPASITVTAPNGGEDWQVGTTQTITWTSVNTSGDVRLEYSTDNGSGWSEIIASTADDGTHDWIIPDDPSTECLVRITDTDGDPSDVSDAVFTISAVPSITVTAPNGGEDWTVGTTQTITWTSENTSGNVRLEYSTDNGSGWSEIIASTSDDGTHDWTIPDDPSTDCLVRVTDTDGDPSDVSDAVFTISAVPSITVTAPNGGENWAAGTVQVITWASVNTSGTVKLEYSTTNGSAWNEIVASTSDDGAHDWTIPTDPSTECLVRVSDTDGDPMDTSDAVFTISAEPGDPVTDLTASVDGENILLEWSALPDVSTYHVYRGTSYDFAPDFAGGTNRIGTDISDQDAGTDGIQWTDTGNGADVVGDVDTHYFYRVTGSSGVETEQSNLAGEFDVQLETTSGTDINELVVIMDTQAGRTPILTAEDLAQAIPNCTDVYRWDAAGQGQVGHPKGTPIEDFDIIPGYPYIVNVTAPTVWTNAGSYSMPTFDLITTSSTDINHIGVPFEKSSLTTAEALGSDIPNCTDVYYWDVAGQGQVGHPVGTPVEDFPVYAAHAYYVNVTAASTWPEATSGSQPSLSNEPLAKVQRSSSSGIGSNIPHTAYGTFVSNDLTATRLRAWIDGREREVLTEASVGSGIKDTYWWIGVGNFPTAWRVGEVLHVELFDATGQLVGQVKLSLTEAGSDQAAEVELGVLSQVQEQAALPDAYKLYANYPNPFNPETTIAFDLPTAGHVTLEIFDVRGVLVYTVLNKHLQGGHYKVHWSGRDFAEKSMASGLYFYKLTANEFVETRKMVLAK